jgi:hypothetical protein
VNRGDPWMNGDDDDDVVDGGCGEYGDDDNGAGGEEGVMVHIRSSLYERHRWQHRYCNDYRYYLQSALDPIIQPHDLPASYGSDGVGIGIMARVIRHLNIGLARGAMVSCKKFASALVELEDCNCYRRKAEDESEDA